MNCPHCKAPFGPVKPELEIGAAAFCPRCDWNLTWNGTKWVAGDRDKNWWERTR